MAVFSKKKIDRKNNNNKNLDYFPKDYPSLIKAMAHFANAFIISGFSSSEQILIL